MYGTVDASRFFTPKILKTLGTFQDGGLRHNNPLNIALWESRFLWPQKGEPDFALSLGTGTPYRRSSSTSPVKDRFFQRIMKTFMLSLDGEKTWDEFVNSLPETSRSRFHRLNLSLSSSNLGIDDVSIIENLKRRAQEHFEADAQVRLVRDSIWASLFYFELEDCPQYVDSKYVCAGHVLFRLNLPEDGQENLYRRLKESSALFLVDGRPVACVDSLPKTFPPFKRKIRFTVSSLSETLGISLRGITLKPRLISGSPKSVKELMKLQMLQAPFGRYDHLPMEKSLPSIPARKRKVDLME